jgi:hypothetical protein
MPELVKSGAVNSNPLAALGSFELSLRVSQFNLRHPTYGRILGVFVSGFSRRSLCIRRLASSLSI